ncbi:hypothetical protein DID96_23180 [Burkholderia sp. Bp8963]|nr:hypothetical protein DID96_23180 [Burkholderia sp. Bp8963]
MSPHAHVVLVLAIGWLAAAPGRGLAEDRVMHFDAHVEAPQNELSDRPMETDEPQHALVIHGRKDPKVELWLGIDYASTNPQCRSRTWFGRIMGAPETTQVIGDNVRLPAGQDRFDIRFLLDRYEPGRCGWQPVLVRHAEFVPGVGAGPGGWSALVGFSDTGRSEATIGWSCRLGIDATSPSFLGCFATSRGDVARMSSQGGTVNVSFALVQQLPQPPVAPVPQGLQTRLPVKAGGG